MKIIEQFIQGKNPDQSKCEDGIFINDAFVAVIDGATSKSSFSVDNKSSGKIATELILKALEKMPFDVNATKMMLSLNAAITDWYKHNNLYEHMKKNTIDRCTAGGVIIYSNHTRELWLVGDCQALIDGKQITNEKYIDILLYDLRAFFLESEILQGKSVYDLLDNDTGRELILPLIKRQMQFQNLKSSNKFVYDVIDGFFTNTTSIKTVSISNAIIEIVLASDGYPKVLPTLSETEEILSSVLKNDPLLFQKFYAPKGLVKGNHSFDDRAYVRVDLK